MSVFDSAPATVMPASNNKSSEHLPLELSGLCPTLTWRDDPKPMLVSKMGYGSFVLEQSLVFAAFKGRGPFGDPLVLAHGSLGRAVLSMQRLVACDYKTGRQKDQVLCKKLSIYG